MKISVKINQIKNGYILHLFDMEGPAEHNMDLFLESIDEVLEKIKAWTKEASE